MTTLKTFLENSNIAVDELDLDWEEFGKFALDAWGSESQLKDPTAFRQAIDNYLIKASQQR